MRHSSSWYRRLLLIGSLVSTLPTIAIAQSLADVQPGNRIQLTLRDSLRQAPIFPARQVVVGRFVRATSDSVWLQPIGASEFSVARIAIKRAQESRGASRWRSALTFGFGAAFGFAAAVALDNGDTFTDSRAQDAWIAGGVGLGGGMIIGALSPFEHWRGLKR